MRYYKIEWIHKNNEEYPYLYILEVNTLGEEIKKMEFYTDGRINYATENIENGTFLSPIKFNDIEDYNNSDDNEILKGIEMSKDMFYEIWDKNI
ncbi:DUF6881 domain-containing protein [Flavobacterium covae]|uniref:DUF6881 domain-containing protein n=1 Tax=Flavobacterium covae TaxID=2906076 RepID=UPI000745B2DD|nr:hypothetical protein [Flavobacterium covae]AMA50409.1 hypothetical protein AWN65_13535 [Flavobacterium covae]AMA50426.1 hypothetical protein AWN65_13640 [Flavobacterium covae]AND64040.1 hypothetical protein AX766_06225 [Flavobacterium covae]AND64045.1 hypothetical protein AX766_06260 [Flavobacterium covae]AND64051.1 hypothetical protein AX766_06300 [Flavobacterium covae]